MTSMIVRTDSPYLCPTCPDLGDGRTGYRPLGMSVVRSSEIRYEMGSNVSMLKSACPYLCPELGVFGCPPASAPSQPARRAGSSSAYNFELWHISELERS